MVDMSAFIAAKSDQLNADDLMSGPSTITVTKVTASPDAAEQPVSIHYEGGEGRPWKPCKTMRRILVGVWGKDATKYVGRSLTLYRDPNVAFGGLQVGGIRVSHMSDISEDKTVALLVTRGRKAPFKIKPLVNAPTSTGTADFSGQLAELRTLAKPGNMDALGAKWQEIGAEARKALAAELPALKAACNEPEPQTDDVPFGDEQPDPQVNDQAEGSPAEAKAAEIKAVLAEAPDAEAVERVIAEAGAHYDVMPDEQKMQLDVAFSQARSRFAVQGSLVE
jgi:hypothetical protein